MKILYYNWVDYLDAERRGGGVSVYQKNLIAALEGDPEVEGVVRLVDRERIAILREDPRAGRLCVHFPRIGYRVAPA